MGWASVLLLIAGSMGGVVSGHEANEQPGVTNESTWRIEGRTPSGQPVETEVVIESFASGDLVNQRGCLTDPDAAPRVRWTLTCVVLPERASLTENADEPGCSLRRAVGSEYRSERWPTLQAQNGSPLAQRLEDFWRRALLEVEAWREIATTSHTVGGSCDEAVSHEQDACAEAILSLRRGVEQAEIQFWMENLPTGCVLPSHLGLVDTVRVKIVPSNR